MAKTVRAFLIMPDGGTREIALRRASWCDHASELLDGAYIRPMNNIGETLAALMDEDGPSKKLPLNRAASTIVDLFSDGEYVALVGPVIITGPIKKGYPTDLTDGIRFE